MVNVRTDGRETTVSVTTAVVEAVADHADVDVMELRPLHEVVDPDALNALFAPRRFGDARPDGWVSFTYCGCEVIVHGDSHVRVRDDGTE